LPRTHTAAAAVIVSATTTTTTTTTGSCHVDLRIAHRESDNIARVNVKLDEKGI
jgi:hypothetical protein